MTTHLVALAFILHAVTALTRSHPAYCNLPAYLDAGVVCGLELPAEDGSTYVSFRGVPYAKQPLGELRFKELEPPEPWGVLNATTEGPICYQTDVLYETIMQPQGMSEACIHANIHVPREALPYAGRRLRPPYLKELISPGLPILVFIHGGGFAFGSGDTDLHGPEYLVSKKVIVVTFNYRLNVFGFLSMNTTQIPGNAGLRDQVTLLRWVQRNAKAFGGDPNDITLAGQSAGAVATHLLTLSTATEGLFRRAILMSGTASSAFYSPTPVYAQLMAGQLLQILGITSTDPDEIYRQLIEVPAQRLSEANKLLLEHTGLVTFVPIIESPLPGVTTIIDDDPDVLIANGRGKRIPLLIGYTSAECETFRKRFDNVGLVKRVENDPTLLVQPKELFTTPRELLPEVAKKIENKYHKGTRNLDNFIQSCSDGFFEYPALKLSQNRVRTGSAPTFLYRFSYESHSSVIRDVTGPYTSGVGHIEDLTYVFKVNSVVSTTPPSEDDICMKNLMTDFVVNFMTCSKPICDDPHLIWPAANSHQFDDILSPTIVQDKDFSPRQRDIIEFFDSLSKNGVK